MWKLFAACIMFALLLVDIPASSQQSTQFRLNMIQATLVSTGQLVGQMTATNNPTSWSITAGNSSGFFAIDNSGNITVTAAGASGLSGQTGQIVLTVQATNSYGSSTGTATINYAPAGAFAFNSSFINGGGGAQNIGANFERGVYYDNMSFFSDLMIDSNGNNSPWDCSGGSVCALDATGAPTASGANTNISEDFPSGTYTLSFTGSPGAVTTSCGSSGTPTTNGGVTSVPVTWTRPSIVAGQNPFCGVTVNSLPASNIHFRAPAADTMGDWLISALVQMAPFSTIRFMDNLYSNGGTFPANSACNNGGNIMNCTQQWAWNGGANQASGAQGRTFPFGSGVIGTSSGGQTSQGLAYDYIIEYANITGKDVWINVPPLSSDNYVCRLARLFRFGESGASDNGSNCSPTAATTCPGAGVPTCSPVVPSGMNATSHVYVEYTNEQWNFGFSQTENTYCMANHGPESGKSCPANVTSPSFSAIVTADVAAHPLGATYTGGSQISADFTRRDGVIFKQVFGSRSGQILNTFNKQAADGSTPAFPPAGLSYVASNFGGCSTCLAAGGIDRIAIAPYGASESGNCTSGNVSGCNSDNIAFVSPGGASYGWTQQGQAVAASFNVPMVSYEGGPNVTSGSTTEVNTLNNIGTETAWKDTFTVMWVPNAGQTVFTWYIGMGDYSGWGSKPALHNPGSARFDAMTSLVLHQGDVNMDGVVNQADCTIVKNNLGLSGAWRFQGDLNADGSVGADDEALVNANLPGGNGTCP